MTTDPIKQRSLGAVMSSEAGSESDVDDSPLRVSGYISFLLALLSVFSIVALPMVGIAIASILFGMFALRKSDSQSPPMGTTAARIGIVLALLFGAWGTARYQFKQNTLGNQAEYFARQFVKVGSLGNKMYAKELQKSYVNRYLKTMPLEQHYAQEEIARAQRAQENSEYGDAGSPEEDEPQTVDELIKYPPDQEWVLDRPVRIYHKYGHQKAEVVLAAGRGEKPYRLRIIMEYLIHKDNGNGEWHVETCLPYRDRIVAESIL